MRPSDIDGYAGTVQELSRIVPKLRAAWPHVKIIVRADSGFCRDSILSWCEDNNVDYIIGLAKNKRLTKIIGGELHEAQLQFAETGHASRVFKDFHYKTRKSWSRERRVIGKAKHLSKGPNPRFVVTSLPADRVDAKTLYEGRYCARGEMENRIKEQQLYLFANRTSTYGMRSNQLRLLFSTMAYVLHVALREFGLAGTEMAKAQAGTIRTKLLKIGARIKDRRPGDFPVVLQTRPQQPAIPVNVIPVETDSLLLSWCQCLEQNADECFGRLSIRLSSSRFPRPQWHGRRSQRHRSCLFQKFTSRLRRTVNIKRYSKVCHVVNSMRGSRQCERQRLPPARQACLRVEPENPSGLCILIRERLSEDRESVRSSWIPFCGSPERIRPGATFESREHRPTLVTTLPIPPEIVERGTGTGPRS
ncbi:MAG: IS1380 family transposase [Planctomycetota bacterium]|nr:IS1380 family transposase [Planctomycetota bacterium]